MAGLNISNYLSTATGINSPSSTKGNSVSSLFSSLNKANNNSSDPSLFGVNLSDYSSVKSGSYYKLMKKYYSNDNTASEDDYATYIKKQDITSDKAAAASSSINDLMDEKFTDENRESVNEKISKMVDDYNSMVKNATNSDSSSIKQKATWMTNLVSQYSDVLKTAGISINSDKTLSIDKDSLNKADMTSLKNTFGSNANSFANKVLYKSEQIYSLAKTYGSSATAYTSNGTYSRDYSSNYESMT